MGKDCIRSGCWGCRGSMSCKCNGACYFCDVANKMPCAYGQNVFGLQYRERYLCFTCRRVWKNKYTKWLPYKINGDKYIKYNFIKQVTCYKCGEKPIEIYEKFRIPPTKKNNRGIDKYWIDLERRYKEDMKLVHEFDSYCPNDRYLYSNSKHKESKQVLEEGDEVHPKFSTWYSIGYLYSDVYKAYQSEVV